MHEAAEERDRESPTDPAATAGVPVRVEPDAAVVAVDPWVPPDRRRESPAAFRPFAAARALGGRLRGLLGGRLRGLLGGGRSAERRRGTEK
ncbi:hypothetical protein [Halobaculum litoreum]|uniref:Uncharacterized protein n=1 Tax=Halobaculum litoreum TaxID=3031998 RepID=A0ABD5XP81_9EURY|nr:hypothetical protein [Halobaculum sp. DT92]